MPPSSSFKPILRATILILIASALSSCAYLRLLRFKNQLKDFDQNVAVEHVDGLQLNLKKPVIKDSDFVYITGSEPNEKHVLSTTPRIEEWIWRFEKLPPESQDDKPFVVDYRTRFEDGLLTQIAIAPELLEVIPAEYIVTLFRNMGRAKINKLRRSALVEVANGEAEKDCRLPTWRKLLAKMGAPSKSQQKSAEQTWSYVFNFYNPDTAQLSGQFELNFLCRGAPSDESQIDGFTLVGKAN